MGSGDSITDEWLQLVEKLGPGPAVYARMCEMKGPPGLRGSSRGTWQLGAGHVVKVAKDEKGIAQSRNEVLNRGRCAMFNSPVAWTGDYGAALYPLASPIDANSFARTLLNIVQNGMPDELEEMHKMYIECPGALLSSELKNPSNWGIVDGRLKLLDFGMDMEVSEKYYPGLNGPVVSKGRTAAPQAADPGSSPGGAATNVKETT